ncbi:hypothetical protein FJZ26_01030 [Candidatus Parvarchaeota archaeon]|nr:hypothetical protein [Candidatus Parvarchaeota archaeon]
MNLKKLVYAPLVAIFLLNMAAAQGSGGFNSLVAALSQFCVSIKTLVPMAAMLMIVGAGALYAVGQMMGAETRARANVWATAMLIGAVIGVLIVVIAPPFLNYLYGGGNSVSC